MMEQQDFQRDAAQSSASRLRREQEFHDKRFSDVSVRTDKVGRFYKITQPIKQCYEAFLFANAVGARVLEYGCGTGSYAFKLSTLDTKSVVGIDISAVAIEHANARALEKKSADKLSFQVMNAEALEFSEKSVDLICGSGILHHLDLEKSMQSILRVLTPEGAAVFVEPLGHNMLINAFRNATPDIRSEDEHPLLMSDLDGFKKYFNDIDFEFFCLTAVASAFLFGTPLFKPSLKLFGAIDKVIFALPFLRRFAWQVVIKVSQPRL